uniref:Retrotransposon gag domain-containing protein n=1 Tax=Brassica oleracea var. oleracea TaxID=109376 RepID=A0A0D3CH64_BRAOL
MTHRSLSYSGLDEINTWLQHPRSTLIQFQNGSTERQGEPRTRTPPSNHSIPENRTPSATRTPHQARFDNLTEQARRHDLRAPVNIDLQREGLAIRSETEAFQNYIERNDAELKRIHAIVHMATSSAPDIDMVIEKTRRTPFTSKITSVKLHHVGKLKFPECAGNSDPKSHIRAFRLAISRAHLTDDEKKAGYSRFFGENLTGAALEWFTGLEENLIDNFTQLVSTFLKQYSVFIETRVTETDLWNLKQVPFELLRAYINKFREIKAKISYPNEVVALAALKNCVWFSSKFREELAVRAPISLDDALHRASYFAPHEEEVAALKEQYSANKNNATKKPTTPKEPATKGQHS